MSCIVQDFREKTAITEINENKPISTTQLWYGLDLVSREHNGLNIVVLVHHYYESGNYTF